MASVEQEQRRRNLVLPRDGMTGWPNLRGADVKIVITGSRQYDLHSNVLGNSSDKLAGLMLESNPDGLEERTIKSGHLTAYRLEAARTKHDNESCLAGAHCLIELVPIATDEFGRNRNYKKQSVGLDLENGMVPHPHFIAFDLVLGAFYNRPIELGDFKVGGLTDILAKALQVVVVAEYLEVVYFVTKPIEAALLACGQTLHRSIAADPAAWLDFAYRMQSKTIYREAMIHAVGMYNSPIVQRAYYDQQNGMISATCDILHKKVNKLMGLIQKTEKRVNSYYPPVLQREQGIGLVDKDKTSRADYGNDILMWVALTAFRHFVMENIIDDNNRYAADMGYEFFSALYKGGDAYLSKGDREAEFNKRFPMSGKGCAVVEEKLNEIKEVVSGFVKPFFNNESMLETGSYPVNHFTCTFVNENEFPWTDEFEDTWTRYDEEVEVKDEEDSMEGYDELDMVVEEY